MATTTSIALNATAVNETTGQSQRADDIVLCNDTITATTTGTWIDVGEGRNLALKLVLASVTGTTPTYDVTVKTSSDKGVTDTARAVTSGATSGAFAQQTAAGTTWKCFGPTDRYVNIVITVTGTTPSAVVTCTGKVN